jgi:DNA-binding response OmpR family regulator
MMTQPTANAKDAREAHELLMAGLAKTVVYLLEGNRDVAVGLRLALRQIGLTNTRSFSAPPEMMNQLNQNPADVVIFSEHPDYDIFDLGKKLRQGDIGRNPFAIVSMLVSETKATSRDFAVRAGADAIMIKPVMTDKIMDQLTRLARTRLPFIATTDYIGPERRANTDRPSAIPLIKVVNTLQYRLEGRIIAHAAIESAISVCMSQVWTSQLQSNVLKFHYICKTVAQNQTGDESLARANGLLRAFLSGLETAASISRKLGKHAANATCIELAARIAPLTHNEGRATEADIKTMQDVTAAFAEAMAKLTPKPGV